MAERASWPAGRGVPLGQACSFLGVRTVVAFSCHLLAVKVKVRVVWLTCGSHSYKTASMLVTKIMAAVY